MYPPRKTGIQVFEPTNPEYSLIDAMTTEVFENYSSEIKWWIFSRTETDENRDELDKAYGEASRGVAEVFSGPYDVSGTLEVNPILQELTRLGAEQIEEIDFYTNIAAMQVYLKGENPKQGDIFRVTWIQTNTDRRFIFYRVANVTPVDIYNMRYTNWLINAEQELLSNVPENIRTYSDGM